MFKQGLMNKEKLLESFQGWNAYAKWANNYNLREKIRILFGKSPEAKEFNERLGEEFC